MSESVRLAAGGGEIVISNIIQLWPLHANTTDLPGKNSSKSATGIAKHVLTGFEACSTHLVL